jgi:hypothetical protein
LQARGDHTVLILRPVKLNRRQPRSNLNSTVPAQALIGGNLNDLLK